MNITTSQARKLLSTSSHPRARVQLESLAHAPRTLVHTDATLRAVTISIPLRLPSMANARLHWAVRHRIVANQRAVVRAHLMREIVPELPVSVTLIRIGPQKLDFDNAVNSFKGVVDEIAACYGVDDGGDAIEWRYAQEIGAYGMRVVVEKREASCQK